MGSGLVVIRHLGSGLGIREPLGGGCRDERKYPQVFDCYKKKLNDNNPRICQLVDEFVI